jgi:hypothetical protein
MPGSVVGMRHAMHVSLEYHSISISISRVAMVDVRDLPSAGAMQQHSAAVVHIMQCLIQRLSQEMEQQGRR